MYTIKDMFQNGKLLPILILQTDTLEKIQGCLSATYLPAG